MIKQNRYLENLLVFQYSLSPAHSLFKYMDRVNWTFGKKQKQKKTANHFVRVGEGRVVAMVMLVGLWVGLYQ